MDPELETSSMVVRTCRRWPYQWLIALLFTPVILMLGVAFLDPSQLSPLSFLLGSFVGIGAWAVIRGPWMAIIARRDCLIIRNLFRTYTVPWADISGIDPPLAHAAAMNNAGIQVRLRDGRVLSASLYAANPLEGPDHADSVVSELRQFLSQFGDHSATEPYVP